MFFLYDIDSQFKCILSITAKNKYYIVDARKMAVNCWNQEIMIKHTKNTLFQINKKNYLYVPSIVCEKGKKYIKNN